MKKIWIKDKDGRRLHTKIIDSGTVELTIAQPKEVCANCEGDHASEQCDQDNWTHSEQDFNN